MVVIFILFIALIEFILRFSNVRLHVEIKEETNQCDTIDGDDVAQN